VSGIGAEGAEGIDERARPVVDVAGRRFVGKSSLSATTMNPDETMRVTLPRH
jgi:hypothetical protein